jgi:hypothetical protein
MRADSRRTAVGAVLVILSQILLMTLVVEVGARYAVGDKLSTIGIVLVTLVTVACLLGAAGLLKQLSIAWSVTLWAIAVGAGILSIRLFFSAFPFSVSRLVPSLVAFVVFLAAGALLARNQEGR